MRRRIVALGGGKGLSAALRALKTFDVDITAVVTVADDGGSSGRIRATRDVVPPGDLRKALIALSPNDDALTEVFGYRFGGTDDLTGHAVGNLVLTGLMETLGDPVAAIAAAARMLDVDATVLPMATVPVDIEASVETDGVTAVVRGQHNVATSSGVVQHLRLRPEAPPACPQALEAIAAADWLVLGPGSWYTSVMPHLLVPQLRDAIEASTAKKAIVLNLDKEPETDGLTLAEHVVALRAYAPELRADIIIADTQATGEPEPVARAAQSLGAQLLLAPVAEPGRKDRHDWRALARALKPVI
ncbi:MAG TPA: uridine diphosphate-N-acetylglucosamine-binding protein YvcK [Stackebrandtia sp.]|uniref:gluconeogenesis factor YvcK family protein n=1 Tax=Stackebrandtia sp. TaxID=2023065 RepID=UPI002D365555|nr:uridine diphosphate-N-acetylglucosamine-binding protein YvcK [Stackebrandtia sp.]HZE41704.1 uridine diphosphate-N-acetylglucosamine-binding protein YvcK [Stackebrandtia sp.]